MFRATINRIPQLAVRGKLTRLAIERSSERTRRKSKSDAIQTPTSYTRRNPTTNRRDIDKHGTDAEKEPLARHRGKVRVVILVL